jgi:hypothetical protein
MRHRRIWFAVLTAAMLPLLSIAPVAAREPVRPASTVRAERPLTAVEQAASDRRVASALAWVAAQRQAGAHLLPLNCLPPNGPSTSRIATDSCFVPQRYLPVSSRDQIRNHYCGPAVGQVIANYTWAVAGNVDKYSQTTIAGWMKTDINGMTNAPELRYGLEKATAGAPRRPAGWAWVVTDVRDLNGSGSTGDELQAFVQSNVSNSKMPLAIPVKPHAPESQFNLSSWPKPVNSVGHWIAAYGWYGFWNGGDFSRVYFADSSRDEGGSTGLFWNPTRHIAGLIGEHTKRLVW